MVARMMITSVLITLFLFSGLSHGAMLLDKVVAVVNKEVITWGELYRTMEFKASDEFKVLSDADKRKVLKENEASFLESMIDTKLQVQAAKKLDIDASSEEIGEAIEGMKKKYAMSDKEFVETMKKEGFSMDEYKKLLGEQIILSKVVTQQVRNKIVITDREVAEFMAKNADEGYRIRQIFLKKNEKDGDTAGLETRAEEIYQRLKSGEDFSQLAAQYSDDTTSRKGGDLGFVKKEYLGKEFLNTLSQMKVGEVSKPFWTARGIHIIKLEEREEAKSTDEAREAARKKLFEKRFSEDYRSWLKSLREKSFVEVRL